MCGASISELDDEQWEANTSVDTARGGKDNITPNKETVSESRPGAIPEMTMQMDGAKSTDKEIVRHFQRIAVSAQCPDAVRCSVHKACCNRDISLMNDNHQMRYIIIL